MIVQWKNKFSIIDRHVLACAKEWSRNQSLLWTFSDSQHKGILISWGDYRYLRLQWEFFLFLSFSGEIARKFLNLADLGHQNVKLHQFFFKIYTVNLEVTWQKSQIQQCPPYQMLLWLMYIWKCIVLVNCKLLMAVSQWLHY